MKAPKKVVLPFNETFLDAPNNFLSSEKHILLQTFYPLMLVLAKAFYHSLPPPLPASVQPH